MLVNRAVQGRYNLGSTIKPFVAWSAMHSGVIGANEVYVDKGSLQVLESIPKDVCASGVRCEFKNATNVRTQTLVVVRARLTVADALGSEQRRLLLSTGGEVLGNRRAQRSSVDPVAQGQVDAEGRPPTLRVRLPKTGVQLPFEWPGRIP